MNKIKKVYLAVGLFALFLAFAGANEDVSLIPRVSYVDGDVSMQESSDTGWSTVDVNLPLQPGDRVVLDKEGLLELEIDDGSLVRLNEYSELMVIRLSEDTVRFDLLLGEMIVRVNSGADYIVRTPYGEVGLLEKGIYRINVRKSQQLEEVLVQDGKARFVNDFVDRKISDGKRLAVYDSGRNYVVGQLEQEDEFDNWSARRDSRYAGNYETHRYIPETVYVGASDLDRYGRWVYLADYGYCWTPSVYVSGWAPYRYGYWRYSSNWGWNWISYDPWGWLPYHYGRWWCSPSFGWVWLPGSSWGCGWWSPGLVRFSSWDSYVGWIPLGPGDYYHGYYHGHPHGYHGGNTYVQNNTVVNNYYNLDNAGHHNAVTYVNSDDFRQGRGIGYSSYSRSNASRGSARSADGDSFRPDEQVVRELVRRERIVEGTPKVDPLRASAGAQARGRVSTGGESSRGSRADSPVSGTYRSGSVSVGRTRGESSDTTVSRGNSDSSTGRAGSYSSTGSENRGRPDVSRGNTQDRSRSRIESSSGNSSSGSRGSSDSSGRGSSSGSSVRPDTSRGSSSSSSSSGSSSGSSRGSDTSTPRTTPSNPDPPERRSNDSISSDQGSSSRGYTDSSRSTDRGGNSSLSSRRKAVQSAFDSLPPRSTTDTNTSSRSSYTAPSSSSSTSSRSSGSSRSYSPSSRGSSPSYAAPSRNSSSSGSRPSFSNSKPSGSSASSSSYSRSGSSSGSRSTSSASSSSSSGSSRSTSSGSSSKSSSSSGRR